MKQIAAGSCLSITIHYSLLYCNLGLLCSGDGCPWGAPRTDRHSATVHRPLPGRRGVPSVSYWNC